MVTIIARKNWDAVCKLSNSRFRLTVALMEDEELLSKLSKGFPELFLAEPQPPHGPFPVSMIRDLTQRLSDQFNRTGDPEMDDGSCGLADRRENWTLALDHLHIPYIDFDKTGVPGGTLAQLLKQKYECGMKMVYEGIEMVLVHTWTEDIKDIGSEFTEESSWCLQQCCIAPASFFDFDK